MKTVLPKKATQPTFYFIGVTTTQSSIMKVFPRWAQEVLGLKDTILKGIDIEIHADDEEYREVVDFIKNDDLSLGALVTTHKLDLFEATEEMFDYLDPYAVRFRELSCISKRNGRLRGHAKDPIASGLALESFIPNGFWRKNKGEVLIMGAGGSALAISCHLAQEKFGDDCPSRIVIANRSQPRLDDAAKKLSGINNDIIFEYKLGPNPEDNDAFLKQIKPYSLIVNATGLGKDRPGSPLTDAAQFPESSVVWELNYRGNLIFLEQANRQKDSRNLQIEDGWLYFIHGWTQVIAEVFDIEISKEKLTHCERIAAEMR
jgi:shikimate 5-dehydrogenase